MINRYQQKQLYIFRLKEHYQRLLRGCQLLNIKLPYSLDELCQITVEIASKGGFQEDIYIRPVAYKSSQELGTPGRDFYFDSRFSKCILRGVRSEFDAEVELTL